MKIICLFFLYIGFACNNQSSVIYNKNVIALKSEPVQINALIGNPYDIFIRDSLLIYYDYYDGKFLSVFDLKKNLFMGRYISEGNGPGEAVAPLYILSFPEKENIYLYQRNTSILNTVNIPKLEIQDSRQLTSSTSWKPFELQRTKDFYVGLGIFENGLFSVYNLNCGQIYEGGQYPFDGEKRNKSEAFLSYQGAFCTNADNNKFAFGCLYSDYIAFYEIKNNKILTLKEYSSYDVKVNYNNNHVIPEDNCIISYTSAFGTQSYCYMLFSGETYADKEKRDSGGNYIVVFDWNGNYVKTFKTDREIYNFCVDVKNDLIYATAQNENGEKNIVKFKI